MTILIVTLALWGVALWLMSRVARERPAEIRDLLLRARDQARFVAPRLLVGVLGAGFYARLMPEEAVGGVIGPGSGLAGALLAAGAGAVTPGGPIVAFSIAAALRDHAGPAQVMLYVVGWSFCALTRTLSWEVPMLGGAWVRARLGASLPAFALIAGAALILL